MEKYCNKCKTHKHIDEFYNQKDKKDGKASICRSCKIQYNSNYRKQNVIKLRKINKLYRQKQTPNYIIKKKRDYEIYKTKDSGLYSRYFTMISRCKKETGYSSKYYFGKNIICEWKSYEDFKDDMYESYIEHLEKFGHKQTTLDRIDSDKNYCKENCRWATWKQQGEGISKTKQKNKHVIHRAGL